MEIKVDLVKCTKCGHVREKFLIGCPECGSVENKEVDVEKDFTAFVKVTLESIEHGAQFYKAQLDDEQKRFFKERIPSGQPWEFYAGVIVTTRMMLPWLKSVLSFEQYSDPISVINSRVLYVMSFKKPGEKRQFCNFLNKLNMELTDEFKDDSEGDIQTEIGESDDNSPTRGTSD